MKRENQIIRQLKEVKFRYYKKIAEKKFKENAQQFERKPCNCKHNVDVDLGDRKLSFCSIYQNSNWYINNHNRQHNICSEEFDLSMSCDLFELKVSEDDYKKEIKAILDSKFSQREIGLIAAEFPDVAALLWVLDQENLNFIDNDEPEEEDKSQKELEIPKEENEMKNNPIAKEESEPEELESNSSVENQEQFKEIIEKLKDVSEKTIGEVKNDIIMEGKDETVLQTNHPTDMLMYEHTQVSPAVENNKQLIVTVIFVLISILFFALLVGSL